MAFEIRVASAVGDDAGRVARALFDAANRAVGDGAEAICFRLESVRLLAPLLHAIGDIKKRHQIPMQIAAPQALAASEKLARVAALAGVEVIAQVADEPGACEVARLLDHPELLPHDFLHINERTQGDRTVREALMRPTYRCNERCAFCWIHPGQNDVPLETILTILTELVARGVEHVTLSGGEPTLHPELEAIIRAAKREGLSQVVLQTNGVLLASRPYLERLADAGLYEVFLALHGHRADVADAITGLQGGFEKTVQALGHLLDMKIGVIIDHVISNANVAHLPDFARFCVAMHARHRSQFQVNFAVANPMGAYETRYLEHVPRLNDLRTHLLQAFDILQPSPVKAIGFNSDCGPPLCALAGHPEYLDQLVTVHASPVDFVKPPACNDCWLSPFCRGLRRPYAERFGTAEVIPFSASSRAPKNRGT